MTQVPRQSLTRQIKWDGFRSLLYSDKDGVRRVSGNANTFKSFPRLCYGLAGDLTGRRCVLDGEIVCFDTDGKPQFRDPLFRRTEQLFYVFDILWDEHAWSDDEEERRRFRNGENLRYLPLIDRSSGFMRWCPSKANVSSTATTSTEMAKGHSGLHPRTTLKESWHR
jgi:ATP-dependent DNA ligase